VKRAFVIPAQAGIYLRFFNLNLAKMDAGFRRHDGLEFRLRDDADKFSRLQIEGCLIRTSQANQQIACTNYERQPN
jgi:hypothetical protein